MEVKKENQALKQRLNLLSGKISLCLEIEKENNQLRTLFNMTPQTESKRLVARVIGVSPSPFVRMLKLNQGSEKGVKKGMAVKAPQGVVGFVFRVFKNYCDVLTITDPRSSVDIIVFRNRTRGMVKGSGSSEDISCSVHYILKETDLIVGDKVVTSGMGNRFPKGLPVGEVAKISKKPYGFYLQARLKPAVDLSRLEYAEILLE